MEAGRSTKAQAPFINWFAYQGKMEKVSSKQNLFLDIKFQFFGYIPFYRRGWTGNLPIFPYGHNKRALTIEHSDDIKSINWAIVGKLGIASSNPSLRQTSKQLLFQKKKKKKKTLAHTELLAKYSFSNPVQGLPRLNPSLHPYTNSAG